MSEDLLSREEWAEHIASNRAAPIRGKEKLLALRHEKAQMYYAIAGVPKRYRHLEWLADAEEYVGPEAIGSFEEAWGDWYGRIQENGLEGQGGFYFYGQHNSGKTSLAVLTMLSACDFVEDLPDPFYLHVGTYVTKCRMGLTDSLAEQWFAKASQASVFVFDDVGSEAGSDYAREQVTALLEARVSSVYPTIFTGNIPPEDLEDALGGRISARILRYNVAIRI